MHSQKYTNKSFTLTTFSPAHLKHSIKDSSTMFSSPDWLTDWLLKYAYRPRTVLVCTSLLLYMVPHSCSSLLQYICKVGAKGLFIYCFPKSKTRYYVHTKMASLFSLIIISAFMQKAGLNGINNQAKQPDIFCFNMTEFLLLTGPSLSSSFFFVYDNFLCM